ncbi:MAG TPA: hypothetical protein VHO50_04465 [Bacteroidales bacterium]|nr:hypothetical protein [Bacteroidales bacterium]
MKKYLLVLFMILPAALAAQLNNDYPLAGPVRIADWSPNLILQRNTNVGGFIQGIQTKFLDGSDNWFFGNLLQDWIVSKGDYQDIKFAIQSNGNVGIGTSSPNTKFHVYASGGGMEYHPGTDNYFEFIDRYNTQASVNTRFYTRNGYFAFHTGGYSERLRITDDGNVGIGTTDPGNYRLNVSGKIRADEIVVNTSGADFVFDPGYNLPELAEVEKYIEENKHLPDVASAYEMQTDGMSVSEMQTKMLQKIEELTLYIIELNKKIEILEAEKNN